MKKLIYSGLFLFIISLVSCDKIINPIQTKPGVVGSKFITKSNAAVSNFKKVFLEDYTGHTCGNCPAAADVAHALATKYTDTLVVLAVHAGFFAKVKLPEYPASYTTTAGNQWDADFIGNAGNPNGMVNRKSYAGSGVVQKESKWPTSVSIAKTEPFTIKIDLISNYDTSVRALNVNIKTTFLTNSSIATKLSVVAMEDGIIGAQTDYRRSPDLVEDYDFEHMLRTELNGSYGVPLNIAPVTANDSVKVEIKDFALFSGYNDKKVSVVAFVYNANTKEVLQVEKVKIR